MKKRRHFIKKLDSQLHWGEGGVCKNEHGLRNVLVDIKSQS